MAIIDTDPARYCGHRWSKWSQVFSQGADAIKDLKKQARVCTTCGAVSLREVPGTEWCTDGAINNALEKVTP